MNYTRIYGQLIDRAKTRTPPEEYVEHHHIIPRCLGGADDKENIVILTPEEHFVAHVLLVKMYPEHRGLIYAVQRMTSASAVFHAGRKTGLKKKHRKLYGWLKRRFSKTISEFMKENQTGEKNSQYNTFWISNSMLKISKRVKRDLPLPLGWEIGRNAWNKRTCKTCGCAISGKMFCNIHKPSAKGSKIISDIAAESLLYDYESGMPMKEILLKHNRKSEQSVTTFLRKRFPNRKKFLPKGRHMPQV